MPGAYARKQGENTLTQLWKKKAFQGLGRSCLPTGAGGIVSVAP